jgi:hypothetical protein
MNLKIHEENNSAHQIAFLMIIQTISHTTINKCQRKNKEQKAMINVH